VLSERARELAGSMQLQAKSFAIELRVDGTLNKGEFRVQPVWDETEFGPHDGHGSSCHHDDECRAPGDGIRG